MGLEVVLLDAREHSVDHLGAVVVDVSKEWRNTSFENLPRASYVISGEQEEVAQERNDDGCVEAAEVRITHVHRLENLVFASRFVALQKWRHRWQVAVLKNIESTKYEIVNFTIDDSTTILT